jgi:glycosyltransferase involved in cell wall biosynthesis
MSNLLIHSPYADHTGQGNSVTAVRLGKILSGGGYRVTYSEREYSGEEAEVMIALNARKSANAIVRFCELNPSSKLIIILTGTDINHPDSSDEDSAAWASMMLAERLVVLHEASLKQVPKIFREKTCVIHPSVTLPEGLLHAPSKDGFKIMMAGNMRQEKNPELAHAAAEKISPALEIHHYGECTSTGSENVIEHGIFSHDTMLDAMSSAGVLLNTSFQEGGANAICEAVTMGLPVVASAISGNIGMLGEDYAGLFPSNDLDALVNMLEKTANGLEFYALLKKQLATRAPLFTYAQESESWQDLLNGLSN